MKPGAIPIGVLGDSDSHSYHDGISFGGSRPARGGAYSAATFQWTELLAKLRGETVDQGRWGTWGTRRIVAEAQHMLGLPNRSPRKEDFRYNFALSGAVCANLNHGPARQAQRLIALMDQAPSQWEKGALVIRIGVNDLGTAQALAGLADSTRTSEYASSVDACLGEIRATVYAVRARHSSTHVVLVGLFDNSDWPKLHASWQSSEELRRIRAGIRRFNDGLRQLVTQVPHASFFDDHAWFTALWGSRDATGAPAYRSVTLLNGLTVSNTMGDAPENSVLADGHAGLVWNALWARALVEHLNANMKARIPSITDQEISELVDDVLTCLAIQSAPSRKSLGPR